MSITILKSMVYPPVAIDLALQGIVDKLSARRKADFLGEKVAGVFEKAKQVWSPKAVMRCMVVREASTKHVKLEVEGERVSTTLEMGHAGTFLKHARLVILGAYSVGEGLEQVSLQAASNKRLLDSYFYGVIAMEALASVGSTINRLIEEEAASRGWKVGPLLSPGSVHGWELTGQYPFCELLDLETVGIRCSSTGVLEPFNSLSFIVGIGPDYRNEKIDSPCERCCRRGKCTMMLGE